MYSQSSLINRLLMVVRGSWLKGAPGAPLSHEPLTSNNRLIKELFDYILWVLCISRLCGLHLPLRWFASSAQVVCIFRSGGLHLLLGCFASSAKWSPTPPHTDSHPCTRPTSAVDIDGSPWISKSDPTDVKEDPYTDFTLVCVPAANVTK